MAVRRTAVARGCGAVVPGVVAALLLTSTPAWARPAADQEMPFPCGQEWYGSTRSGHSPSWYSIDWNRTDDLGDPMVASAAGVVTRVENVGDRSYGLYAIIDHGDGESTLYAHMQAEFLAVGQRVDQGEVIGRLGESGGVTGPHLHYEQRKDGRGVHPWFHDKAFTFNTTLRSRSCVDTPVAGDWDGDGVDEVGVFRRKKRGVFKLATDGSVRTTRWGPGLGQPVVGDWDGDAVPDLGARDPLRGTFVRQGEDGPLPELRFGTPVDRAVAGDWNADGTEEVGVWRSTESRFLLRARDGSVRRIGLGPVGALPVTGDWNGDGRTDVGTFTAGAWSLRVTSADGAGPTRSFRLGQAGDLPVAGDWNGDGADDLGVWRPGTAVFTLRHAPPLAGRATELVKQRFGNPR